MSNKRVVITQFEDAIKNEIEKYADEIEKDIPTIVETEAKNCVTNIKNYGISAGIPNGAYIKGWKAQKDTATRFGTFFTIYNPKHYRLAHLLEHGHALVVHGKHLNKKARAFPHLSQAEQKSVKDLEEQIKRRIEKG